MRWKVLLAAFGNKEVAESRKEVTYKGLDKDALVNHSALNNLSTRSKKARRRKQ